MVGRTHAHTPHAHCVVRLYESVIYNINLHLPIPNNFSLNTESFSSSGLSLWGCTTTCCKRCIKADLSKHTDHWPLEITTLLSGEDQLQLTVKHSRVGNVYIYICYVFGLLINWPWTMNNMPFHDCQTHLWKVQTGQCYLFLFLFFVISMLIHMCMCFALHVCWNDKLYFLLPSAVFCTVIIRKVAQWPSPVFLMTDEVCYLFNI